MNQLLLRFNNITIDIYDMDWDERAEVYRRAISLTWSGRFNDVRGPPIATWVSTFRSGQLVKSWAIIMAHSIGAAKYDSKTEYNG